jgi:hypothetical protein
MRGHRAVSIMHRYSGIRLQKLAIEHCTRRDSFIENHVFNIWVDGKNDPRGFSNAPSDYYFRTMSVAQHSDTESEAVSKWHYGPACIGPTFEMELILNWVGCRRNVRALTRICCFVLNSF